MKTYRFQLQGGHVVADEYPAGFADGVPVEMVPADTARALAEALAGLMDLCAGQWPSEQIALEQARAALDAAGWQGGAR